MDLTYIFSRQAWDYASSTWKKSLGLGPFITQVVRYFRVDTSTVRRCSTSTIPLDQTILWNMLMLRRVEDHFVVWEMPVEESPVLDFEMPKEQPQHIHRTRPRSTPDNLSEPTSSSPSYPPRNKFERFMVTSMTNRSENIFRLQADVSQLSTRFKEPRVRPTEFSSTWTFLTLTS